MVALLGQRQNRRVTTVGLTEEDLRRLQAGETVETVLAGGFVNVFLRPTLAEVAGQVEAWFPAIGPAIRDSLAEHAETGQPAERFAVTEWPAAEAPDAGHR